MYINEVNIVERKGYSGKRRTQASASIMHHKNKQNWESGPQAAPERTGSGPTCTGHMLLFQSSVHTSHINGTSELPAQSTDHNTNQDFKCAFMFAHITYSNITTHTTAVLSNQTYNMHILFCLLGKTRLC